MNPSFFMRRIAPRLLALAAPLLAAGPLGAQPTRAIALTFDDLPVVSPARDSASQHAITARLLAAIGAGGVPAIGFVNDDQLRDAAGAVLPYRVALLERWLDAGLELGNHTARHTSLHRASVADYRRDVVDGERVLRPLLARRGLAPRFFRHPFLHTGRSARDRAAVEAFLEERGYRVAPVTIDNYDYAFAAAFERALARHDSAGARRVGDAYVAYMDTVVGYYEQQAQALLGRAMPHVLLLHANRLNAHELPRLLARLRRRGYGFVSLERALADPAYRSPEGYTGPAGISWLHRWALAAGRRGAFFAGEPEVPGWVTDTTAAAPRSAP